MGLRPLARAVEIARADGVGGLLEAVERSDHPAREHRCGRRRDGEDGGGDGGQDGPVAVDARVHGGGRVGDADGAVDDAAGGGRHGDVEEVGAERLRGPRAGGDLAGERSSDLRARGEVSAAGGRGVDDGAPAAVDDEHATAGLGGVVGCDPWNLFRHGRSLLECVLDEGGERDGVALDLAGEVLPFAVRVGDRERDLEQREHEHGDGEVGREEPASHGCGASRRPTPRTVSIQRGSPSFFRSEATWTSIVFVGPNHSVFQTSRSMWSRLTTAPGSEASSASRSNSLGVSASSRSVQRRAA